MTFTLIVHETTARTFLLEADSAEHARALFETTFVSDMEEIDDQVIERVLWDVSQYEEATQ